MLGLKLGTDDHWVKNCVEGNYQAILTDHAWCEQKAASNAISLITRYPEFTEMVQAMIEIVNEEMDHFRQVHELILRRGFQLGKEEKDDYVGLLQNFVRKGISRETLFVDKLLFSAMIEARSCERFKQLSTQIKDEELSVFYQNLMASEARHYATFIKLAKKFSDPIIVEARWQEWLAYEAEIVSQFGKEAKMHG